MRVLRQNIWLIVGTVIVGCVLGVAAHFTLLSLYPLYLGEVRFLLKPPLRESMDVLPQDLQTEESVVRMAQTEAARLASRDNLLLAMRNNDVRATTWAQSHRDDSGAFDPESAADVLIEEIRAGHRRGQQIFFVTWRAHEPADVPVVLNAVANTYLETRRREDERRYSQSADVFRRQETALDGQISDLKKQISDFIAANGMTQGQGTNDDRRASELEELAKQITETKKELDVYRARRGQVELRLEGTMEPSADDVREAEDDPVLLNARRDVHDLRTQYVAAQRGFGPDHPEVRRYEALVEAAEQNLKTQRDEIIRRNMRATLKKVSDDTAALEELRTRQSDDYTRLSKELEQMTAHLGELGNMRDRLTQLEEQRREMRRKGDEISTVRARDDAARVDIIQRATIPRDVNFPRLIIMVPITAILVLGLVLLILFTREFMDQRVRYTSDLANLPGGRLLGVIPDLADDPSNPRNAATVVREHPNSVVTEAYRQAAVQIAKGNELGHKAIMVTTAMPGGGNTAVVTNLAAVAQAMVGKVLVIDANFRQPGVAGVLGGNDSAPGLGDLIAGTGTLASVVQNAGGGMFVLGAGTAPNRLPERLNHPRFDEILAEARRDYNVVLLDTPPAVVAGEVMTVANRVDATILLVHAWHDERGLVARLAHQLMDVRSVFLGVILNRPRSTAGGYFKRNAAVITKYSKARA